MTNTYLDITGTLIVGCIVFVVDWTIQIVMTKFGGRSFSTSLPIDSLRCWLLLETLSNRLLNNPSQKDTTPETRSVVATYVIPVAYFCFQPNFTR